MKADVVFAFFGFNESFKGEAGLPQFKADLDKFLKDTLAKNYSGKGTPRVVLFSPIASEKHRDPNFPDPAAINANIALYAAAMAEVATANGVPFVDLFAPSQQLYADAAKRNESLTINGRYLTEAGDKLLAPIIFQSLFGEAAPAGDLEKLRAAVNEKNKQWHAPLPHGRRLQRLRRALEARVPVGAAGREDHELPRHAGGDVAARRAHRQPRQARLGRRARRRRTPSTTPTSRRSPQSRPTSPAPGPDGGARVPLRRGSDREDEAARRA